MQKYQSNTLPTCFARSGNNRVVFNIKGNDYRLVMAIRYDKGLMYVRFVGLSDKKRGPA
jgi:mRNA-degrading endonuclease HigB of HigAB toxin-antitoxin module